MKDSERHRTRAHADPTGKQRQIWNRAAPTYDRQIAFLDRHVFRGGREWLAQRARGNVLEVGIGTGRNIRCYGPEVTLLGVELSEDMLHIAQERAKRHGITVGLVVGDAERLPVGDGTCDTVVCCLSLCTIPDPGRAILEMKRVLAPGGRLLLLDHIGSSWPPLYVLQWLFERVTIRMAGEHFTRRSLPLVRAAGFDIVETERLRAGTVERIHAAKPA